VVVVCSVCGTRVECLPVPPHRPLRVHQWAAPAMPQFHAGGWWAFGVKWTHRRVPAPIRSASPHSLSLVPPRTSLAGSCVASLQGGAPQCAPWPYTSDCILSNHPYLLCPILPNKLSPYTYPILSYRADKAVTRLERASAGEGVEARQSRSLEYSGWCARRSARCETGDGRRNVGTTAVLRRAG
jgi:hypothetical protein